MTLPTRTRPELSHPTEKDPDGYPALDYDKVFQLAEELSGDFYRRSTSLGIHSIIEHTGLINEHLNILREARRAGLQPEHISVHGSTKFPMRQNHAAYLGEKFACIFSAYFTPETWEIFRKRVEREIPGVGSSPSRSRRPKASRPRR